MSTRKRTPRGVQIEVLDDLATAGASDQLSAVRPLGVAGVNLLNRLYCRGWIGKGAVVPGTWFLTAEGLAALKSVLAGARVDA